MGEFNMCCFRTDYSDDAKWSYLKKRWDVDEVEQCSAYMNVMEDRTLYENKSIEELNKMVDDYEYVVADSRTMKDNTFAVVDRQTSRIVRFDVRHLCFPVCNLPLSNVTFDDYYKDVDENNVNSIGL